MPVRIKAPRCRGTINAEPLTQEAFSAFGTVIENPAPDVVPSTSLTRLPPHAVQANQGSALKYVDVTHMKDLYSDAPSSQPSKAVMNMFVCAPRALDSHDDSRVEGIFPCKILERHPFTTQTFIPLGISPQEEHRVRYLVIVAPSLPPSPADEDLPVPRSTKSQEQVAGRGLPDLTRVKAFMAKGSQAVTYGAGTWHAPMVVVGERPIDFVVVQFANGVDIEDCQEADWQSEGTDELSIAVPRVHPTHRGRESSSKL